MSILTEISIGEFLDKLTILQIKSERVSDKTKLKNVRKELQILETAWGKSGRKLEGIEAEMSALRKINETLWEIEDSIRTKEAMKEFDDEFIKLARSVYLNNDRRAEIKKVINNKLGSGLVEEKVYSEYRDS